MCRLSSIVALLCLLSSFSSAQETETRDDCLDATRPHSTRCDQYFRCKVLEDGTHAWVAAQCRKGLVYMLNLGTCVVPDSDWECDLSTENENDHSDENVYGIDNLSGGSTATGLTTAVPNEAREQAQDGPPLGDSSLEFNEIESSGDGSVEQLDSPKVNAGYRQSTVASKTPTRPPSGIMSQQQLDSFLAFYDAQSDPKSKTKPQPLNEKNHLEHLKEIVKQQNQLNRIGNQFRDTSFTWPKLVPLSEQSGPAKSSASIVDGDTSTLKIPPGMEDIIRSILQISQQAIANQKSTPLAPAVEPVVKPIFIPISLNPVHPSGEVQPQTEPASEKKTTEIGNRSPAGPEVNGPLNDNRNSMYNAYQQGPGNGSTLYDHPQQVLYDAYGNRFVPKDPYRPMPPNSPTYNGYNSFTDFGQTPSVVNRPAASPSFTNSWASFGPMPQQQTQSAPDVMLYNQQPSRPMAPQMQSSDTYDKLRDIIERIDQMEAIASNDHAEHDANSDASDADPTDSEQNSDEDDSSHVSSKLKRKLFTLGDSTFDYELYKDSMLPLVEANPGDDRISVVTCMVGSRQPNRTDCFRYYICNPHNGVFQSYTCPTRTAFNKHSRMCDMASYKPCKAKTSAPTTVRPSMKKKGGSSSASDISLLKNELRTAQRYVELIRAEAEQLRLRGTMQPPAQKIIFLPSMNFPNGGGSLLSKTRRKPSTIRRKPSVPVTTAVTPIKRKTKPTVPRCRLEGRMPDPTDHTNYFFCHRKSPNKFIKLKMACPGNLIYCAASQYCTVATNC